MQYTNTLKINGDPKSLLECFKPEIEKRNRSEIKIKEGKDNITIIVSATDAIALKAIINGLINLLTVYEKLQNIE